MTEELKFIQVGDLAKGITENILPESGDLAGRSLKLFFEDGSMTQFHFKTFSSLSWQVDTGTVKRAGQRRFIAPPARAEESIWWTISIQPVGLPPSAW
jgi:hypothetical protein